MNVNQNTRLGLKSARDTLVTQITAAHRHRHCRNGMTVQETSIGSLGTSRRAVVALGRVELMPP